MGVLAVAVEVDVGAVLATVVGAVVLGLGGWVVLINSRVAVVESKQESHGGDIQELKKINTELSQVNERLARIEQRLDIQKGDQ